MGNPFAISTPTNEIKTDANGKAVAVFTVTNNLGKSIRGIASARALENTKQNWLEIEGESERDFPVGGTQQFTVSFNKPAGQGGTAEKFPFRFDVASSSNPDEVFTEGPTVTVEIAKAMLPSAKSFPWWIILIIAVVVILIGGVIAFFVFSGKNDSGNVNANRPAPTPTPSAAGTWISKDNPSRETPVTKLEVQMTDGRFKAFLTPYESNVHPIGPFEGEMKPDGTGEAAIEIGHGFVRIKFEPVGTDRMLIFTNFYPFAVDVQGTLGKPDESYKQVLTKQ